jgi:hypothetical protein
MKVVVIWSLLILIGFGCIGRMEAQVDELIQRYAGENGKGYIKPLITGFGADLNSGLYRTANVPKMGLHINIAINGMIAIFSDDQKKFTATTTGYFYPVEEVEAPTVIGDPKGARVSSPQGTDYVFPGGYDVKSFMIAAPTLTVGSIMGTEASLRYFKAELNKDIGELSLFGIGGRHSISQYIPLSPVDIAVGFFYHKFKIGDIVKSNVYTIHAEAGKSFTVINVYGGLAYESNKATLNYTFDSGFETQEVSLDVTGDNKFRFTAGVGFNFTLFHINVDYSIGKQSVLNAGVSVSL